MCCAHKVEQQSDNFTQTSRQHKGAEVIPKVGLSARGHGPGSVVEDSMLVLFSFSSQSCYGRQKICRLPVTCLAFTDPTLQECAVTIVCFKRCFKHTEGCNLYVDDNHWK